jgi:hypothetical protein
MIDADKNKHIQTSPLRKALSVQKAGLDMLAPTPIHKAHELQENTWTSNNIIVKGMLNTIGILQSRPIPYTVEYWTLYVKEAFNGQKRAVSKRT